MTQTESKTKTAAACLIEAAVDAGVEVCFANPGTSEMDLVAALDAVPGMRTVLGLFEGVCSGMADGYGRMADKPACTLLHMGVGLGNAVANLHNARRAHSPIVNFVGDHASHHIQYDAPLTSDIASLAKPVSDWVGTATSAADVAAKGLEAIVEAQRLPGRVSTLIIPSDFARAALDFSPPAPMLAQPRVASADPVHRAAEVLRAGEPAALYLGGRALRANGLAAANRIAAATGCRVLCVPFPGRLERGAGVASAERMPYFPEAVMERLGGLKHLVLVGAPAPVSFFYYDGYPSSLVPEGCETTTLAEAEFDLAASLEALAGAVGAGRDAGESVELKRPNLPAGELNSKSIGAAIGNLLPEGAIIADESATSGGPAYHFTRTAPRHDAMYLTGGAIGMGLPLATGAAIACPGRPVIALQGDGGGMYTVQALWTQAREGLHVTNIIFSNRAYQILQVEHARAGNASRGPKAESMMALNNPHIDWRRLAEGMGVPATRPETAEAFHRDLAKALAEPGPHLIEAVI